VHTDPCGRQSRTAVMREEKYQLRGGNESEINASRNIFREGLSA